MWIPTRLGSLARRVRVPMFVGSVDAVRAEWADVIVANIDAATIRRIAPELERVGEGRESTLILSGFPEWDVPEGFSVKGGSRIRGMALFHRLRLLAPDEQ